MSRDEISRRALADKTADEPEPTSEADVPSDGADEIGEAMIRDLPRTMGEPAQPVPETSQTKI